jgi:hypothetical protein
MIAVVSKDRQNTGIEEINLQKDKKKEPNPYEEFFDNFPGLKVQR